jgi:hypothetical protein
MGGFLVVPFGYSYESWVYCAMWSFCLGIEVMDSKRRMCDSSVVCTIGEGKGIVDYVNIF